MMRREAGQFLSAAALLAGAVLLARCGGSGSAHQNTITTSGSNVQSITVNAGPAGNYANGVFTSVTVCVPSTSNCQTIDGILVDTGSYGLRILSSAGGGALTLSLPAQSGSIGECAPFVDGYTWGPIATADIQISGESAGSVPVQIIDPTFAAVPAECTDFGIPEIDSLTALGANGILGVGPLLADCGIDCTQSGSANPGLYYNCSSSPCQVTSQAVAQQVTNPVGSFAADNNGVIIELPAAEAPVPSLTGSLVFGIGTQTNNGISGVQVFPINSNGEFNTTFNGQSYPGFVDSGSNANFFLDSGTTSLPACADDSSFYCPSSSANLSATVVSGSATETIKFTVNNADTMFADQTAFVFPGLAGPNAGTFDWGLPFFFGRDVFTAIESRTTSAGTGPYWAF
jgi:Protein of unknown function (DUF3443)